MIMSRIGYLLLGIILTAGALSLGGYRHIWQPYRSHQAGATRGIQAPHTTSRAPQAAPTTNSGSATQISATQLFDWGLNGANLLVGVIGIWMALRSRSART